MSVSTKLIRNFSIIAHIDHGKTTLTDRLLELTNTISVGSNISRLMDTNPIEQERGITIKLAPVRMTYTPSNSSQEYILNLIDTPGHVDFSYEVSRALYACEGAVLVVDATQGIQAQTLANYELAKQHNLIIIPVINKIDLAGAEPDKVAHELISTLGFQASDILYVSAKTGEGVNQLLDVIVERIPSPPTFSDNDPLKALIFNSLYHPHKGVIAFVKVQSGAITSVNRHQLYLYASKEKLDPLEFGFFTPHMTPSNSIQTGEVGYLATGHKDIRDITIGDTLTTLNASITPIEGYQRPQPMVYMDMYPVDASDYPDLTDALEKLALNDASLIYQACHSPALGSGYRMGFLGILHAEIVAERLRREFELDVINTSPSVPYRLTLKKDNQTIEVSSPSQWPKPEVINQIQEPIVALTIYSPETYLGSIMELTQSKRATFVNLTYPSPAKIKLEYLMPLSELITNFYDRLKSVSSGYASVQYQHSGYQSVKAVKVDILLNGEPAEALSFICPQAYAQTKGRLMVDKLKDIIPRSQIEVAIQAAIGGKVIARSTIKAFRKDVTAKLYGGDATRRKKLLEKQKRGKKKMRRIGKIALPSHVFTEVLKL